ncbi:MAG: hypothetical protein LCH36_12550 [Actinobacteria bacterium]|jgi:uncharacterized protein YukE|nr:hypothetical protein [Actinomycetota bacterium]
MYIDLNIPGDPVALHTLADWLSPDLSEQTHELYSQLRRTAADSQMWWFGQAGSAFRETTNAIADAIDPVDVYASDAATVIRAYANRLRRGQDKFDEFADKAVKTWLIVKNSQVQAPIPPPTYIIAQGQTPPPDYGPDGKVRPAGWYEQALSLYEQIAEDVVNWWGELDRWIDEYFLPLMGRVTDFEPLVLAYEVLKTGNELTISSVVELKSAEWESNLREFEDKAKQAKIDADTHRERLRSGDPRISGPASKFETPELVEARKELDAAVDNIKSGTKLISRVGLGLDVLVAVADVMNGGSASSAAAGLLGGTLGGAAAGGLVVGGAALVGVTLPVAVVAGAVVLVGWGASELAEWGWESAVPLDIREAIDAGDWGYVFE